MCKQELREIGWCDQTHCPSLTVLHDSDTTNTAGLLKFKHQGFRDAHIEGVSCSMCGAAEDKGRGSGVLAGRLLTGALRRA